MLTLSCGRNSSRSVATKRYHIYWRLVIHIMPLSLKPLQCMLVKPYMPSAKAVSPRKTTHKSLLLSAPTAPVHTPWQGQLSCTDHHLQRLFKKGHWHAKCHSSGTASQQPTKPNGAEAHHHKCHGKGKKADMVQVNTEEAPPTTNCSSMQLILEL